MIVGFSHPQVTLRPLLHHPPPTFVFLQPAMPGDTLKRYLVVKTIKSLFSEAGLRELMS